MDVGRVDEVVAGCVETVHCLDGLFLHAGTIVFRLLLAKGHGTKTERRYSALAVGANN